MNEDRTTGTGRRGRVASALAIGVVAGGIATAVITSAAAAANGEAGGVQTSSYGETGSYGGFRDGGRGGRGSETEVTGSKAATLKATALQKVPGATVLRVETDADGAAYEVHLRKSDGSFVTVTFNSDLSYKATETGGFQGGGRGGRGSETEVTGSKAATLKATALQKVPGATVLRVETDADGAAYEVHLRKSDGSFVTVTFNSDLSYKATETGGFHGGGHGGRGASSETGGPAA